MKSLTFLFLLLLFFSCSKKEEPVSEEPAAPAVQASQPEIKGDQSMPGYTLISRSDCMSCHKDNQTFIGPSYVDIAAKYSESDTEYLAGKIIDGGTGVWGQVPMQSHSGLSKEDAKRMVAYIMSMKK